MNWTLLFALVGIQLVYGCACVAIGFYYQERHSENMKKILTGYLNAEKEVQPNGEIFRDRHGR